MMRRHAARGRVAEFGLVFCFPHVATGDTCSSFARASLAVGSIWRELRRLQRTTMLLLPRPYRYLVRAAAAVSGS